MQFLSKKELHSKVEIKLEAYAKTKDIEFKVAVNIAKTRILPAITKQIDMLARARTAIKATGAVPALDNDIKILNKLYATIEKGIFGLSKAIVFCEKQKGALKSAKMYAGKGAQVLEKLRSAVDEAEEIVADELWPLAKYQELLLVL